MYDEEDAAWDAWESRAREGALAEVAGVEDEHRLMDTPTMVAFMRNGAETLWINAYPIQHVVIETYPAAPVPGYGNAEMPGTIREHPFAKVDGALTAKFSERVFAHEQNGWQHARPEASH